MKWIPVVLWMGLIYYFSDQPNSSKLTEAYFGNWNIAARKAGHVSEYAILCGLVLFALKPASSALTGRQVVAAAFVSVLYAIADEFHQSFVVGRSAAATDVLVDSAGIAAAAGTTMLFRNRKSKEQA